MRRRERFDQASNMLPSATWRDPEAVELWAKALKTDQNIVVYCVHGHEVSQGVADCLRSQGMNAFYLEGGIDAWYTAGNALVTKS